ncbi:hypothetical protein HDU76_007774 [Blyttiomyces sp. JEL0837]|nr:hypothetical protein HDU76_007774 [Blyttiomyces sp. JEL0837]
MFAIIEEQEDWDGLKGEVDGLKEELKSESIWEDDAQRAIEMQKRLSKLEDMIKTHEDFRNRIEEGMTMLSLAKDENDVELAHEISTDMSTLRKDIEKYSYRMLMSDPADKSGCFVEIRAGAGGTESCDWTAIVTRMYQRWGSDQNYEVMIVDEVKGDVAGFKNVTLQILGEYAYGWCKYETGVHRFVRISKFGESKRQTSFVSVQVYPCNIEDEGGVGSARDIEISNNDIRIEVMRAQGAGGQHVNKTESAVRIVHIPSGIVVTCQNGRSQHQNKATAMQMLQARLYQQKRMAEAQNKADAHATLPENAWGSQIRSYVMQPYQMIKDLRTGYERSDVDNVLDGDLMGMMEASLIHYKKKSK